MTDTESAEQTPRNRGGRPRFQPSDKDRRTVLAMAGYGFREDQIAQVIGIDPKTLRRHFRAELDTGHVRASAKVVESLFQQATQGNVAAAIWWTKARLGWRESIDHRHGGSEDAPPIQVEHDFRDEFARRIAGVATRLGAGASDPQSDTGAGSQSAA